jgi:hypothetical protein
MKYSVEMDLGARIYTSSFIKIGSCVQTLLGGYSYKHTYKYRQQGDLISQL